MKKLSYALLGFLGFFIPTQIALAFSGDMSINSQDINFTPDVFMEGKTIRIYATAKNNSNKDLLGVVKFFDNSNQISTDQAISIFAGKNDGVFIDWTPSYGSHKIAVKIYPWQPEIDDPSNNWIVSEVYAIQDTDHDGIPNDSDDDDDGDGTKDSEDSFPLNPVEQKDTDGDSKGDNTDDDDDNDGVPDKFDDLPLDPNETIDTDKDGIGNIKDTDDDGDGISDSDEEKTGTNPGNPDTDSDKVNDKNDGFPITPSEQYDTDKDSIGNNTDIDDDNDGVPDLEDKFPLNKGPIIQLDDENEITNLLDENTFDASPSYDEDGKIVSYNWEVDGEAIREGNSLQHTFKTLGKHKVKLIVTDDSGQSISKEFEVNVLNIDFYKQIGITLISILLALFIYFKYIAGAKNPKNIISKP